MDSIRNAISFGVNAINDMRVAIAALAPAWFQLLEWMTLVAIVKFVFDRTNSLFMLLLYVGSTTVLGLYIITKAVDFASSKIPDESIIYEDRTLFVLVLLTGIVVGFAASIGLPFALEAVIEQLTNQF